MLYSNTVKLISMDCTTRNGNAICGTRVATGRRSGVRLNPITLSGRVRASPNRFTIRGVAIAPRRPSTAPREKITPICAGLSSSTRRR